MNTVVSINRPSWSYAASSTAALCSTLALVYTLTFILYAVARSALTAAVIVNQDAGMPATLIATWASLGVAALVIGVLLAVAVAVLGAFTGLMIRAVSVVLPRRR